MRALCVPRTVSICLALVLAIGASSLSYADEVLDWNAVLRRAVVTAATPGALQPRIAAAMHVAMFEAYNGIEKRFTSIHDVSGEAPRGASKRAAVVYAAYNTLLAFFPAQAADFANDLDASLAGIAADSAIDNSESIARGREWGEHVAAEIVAWRNTDGLNPPPPPYLGSLAVGKWRPTPPAFAPGLAPNLGQILTFVIPNGSTFRPAGPPPLMSTEYADNVNEVQRIGNAAALPADRSADGTESARFWAGTALTAWFRIAEAVSRQNHLTLSENDRLFTLMSVAMADAVITCWDSKYFYELWRPFHAIRLAGTDNNPATIPDPAWTPLIVTPPYPEYYSGHQSLDRTSATVLIAYFGDSTPIETTSESLPGVTRHWSNFTAAADDAYMARIWGGIHFRFSMDDARDVARKIANYVLEHAAQPLHGKKNGQVP